MEKSILKNDDLLKSSGYINGQWIGAESVNRFDVKNAYSQDLICTLPEMGKAETNNAIEATLDLGCTPFKTFFLITLPIILPAVISGWLLSFTLSLDDLVIASFTSGPGSTTLPMKIYSMVRLGVTPEINAVSTILVGLVALGVVAGSLIGKRQKNN